MFPPQTNNFQEPIQFKKRTTKNAFVPKPTRVFSSTHVSSTNQQLPGTHQVQECIGE
jgi:hypothetical protein